jgi:hypothetical protein
MIDDASIDLLGHALIEAAIPSLHMEDGDFSSLRRDDGKATVGVAEDQQCIGPNGLEHSIHRNDNVANRLSSARAGTVQECIWLPDIEVAKKNLVELVIVILPGVNQHVVAVFIQARDDARQANNLRPRADNRGHF